VRGDVAHFLLGRLILVELWQTGIATSGTRGQHPSSSAMVRTVVFASFLLWSGAALTQTSAPSGGSPPSPSASPPPTPPPASAATPSQQNLDAKPPTSNALPAQGTVVPSQPGPAQTPPQTASPTAPSGKDSREPQLGSGRPQPGGANSSPRADATGKNPLNETYESCLRIWERDTHMSKGEWARACKRVADRLQTLKVQ
jgi:hypothetical protein